MFKWWNIWTIKTRLREALKKCGCKAKLQCIQLNLQQNNTSRRTRKTIWFNPPFSLNIKTNMAEMFSQLIGTHFPPANKLHKIFNRNTLKVSYNCIQNISQIIKGHNKKVTQIKRNHQLDCNCRIKAVCPLNCDCRKKNVTYRCTSLTTFQPKKVYLGFAEGEFKNQRYYNHTQSFWNKNYSNSTTLSSYIWKIKKTKKETPTLVWEIIRTAPPYTNITKPCSLCFDEKLAILMYPNQSELSN